MDDKEGAALSRRQVVGGVGVGIIAAAGPAVAQPQIQPISGEPVMDDPRSKYPKPPFRQESDAHPPTSENKARRLSSSSGHIIS
jgi:hypothetical protein